MEKCINILSFFHVRKISNSDQTRDHLTIIETNLETKKFFSLRNDL